jgi:hypothetical protein
MPSPTRSRQCRTSPKRSDTCHVGREHRPHLRLRVPSAPAAYAVPAHHAASPTARRSHPLAAPCESTPASRRSFRLQRHGYTHPPHSSRSSASRYAGRRSDCVITGSLHARPSQRRSSYMAATNSATRALRIEILIAHPQHAATFAASRVCGPKRSRVPQVQQASRRRGQAADVRDAHAEDTTSPLLSRPRTPKVTYRVTYNPRRTAPGSA